jgi:hypothetical protein
MTRDPEESPPPRRVGRRAVSNAGGEPSDNALEGARQANAAVLRRQGLVERIQEVAGPRGFSEIFEELIRHRLVDERELNRVLTAYAALDPPIVKALGANRMPQRPLRVISGLGDAP